MGEPRFLGMRIGISALSLEIKNAYGKAGVSRYTYNILDELLALPTEHEFVIFVGRNFEAPEHWLANPRVEFAWIDSKARHIRTVWNMFHAIPLAKRHRLDVWYCTNLALPLLCPIPKVLVAHDLFVFSNPEWFKSQDAFIFRAALRLSVPRADHLIAISEFTKKELGSRLGVPPEKVTVAHLGPGNIGRVRPAGPLSPEEQTRLGLPFSRFFMTVGTVEPRKNLVGLARSVGHCAEKLRALGVGVAVVGAKGWKESDLEAEIQRLGVADLIHFMGYVPDDDLPVLYSGSEAMVFPSLNEGFGLPVLEAQLYGAIPICGDRGSIPEVAGPGAIVVDVTNPQAFAEAMVGALDLPDRRERLEANAAFASHFTWESCAKTTMSVLESVRRG